MQEEIMSKIEYLNNIYQPKRTITGANEYGEHRFLLEFELNAGTKLASKNILFIGLNPADATLNNADKTANKILDIACDCQATQVLICNVCSFCNTYFSDFEVNWMSEHSENLHQLKQAIDQADMIIAFWGGGISKLSYEVREDIYNLLKDKCIYIGGQTAHFFPKHITQRDHSFELQSDPVRVTNTLNIAIA